MLREEWWTVLSGRSTARVVRAWKGQDGGRSSEQGQRAIGRWEGVGQGDEAGAEGA